MYLIYCLQNESFKENIVNVGITISEITLKQILESVNKSFIPTPYTIYLTKNVYNNNCIKILYSLMCKFGQHIHDTFFEIQPEIVKQLFDLIQNENINDNVDYDIYENNINSQDKYIIIQNEIEYIIPKAIFFDDNIDGNIDNIDGNIDNIYSVPYIADILTNLDTYYDKLSIYKNTYSNSINDNGNNSNNSNNIDDLEL
jgi:hypothetical protein